jgi:hypothetical protein
LEWESAIDDTGTAIGKGLLVIEMAFTIEIGYFSLCFIKAAQMTEMGGFIPGM